MTEAAATRRGAQGEESAAPMTRGAVLLVFVGLLISMFMFSLNQTVLATALPTIVGELNGWDSMLWVTTAFMLASTATMPAYGKIGDLFGRKPLFLIAISIFILGSAIALFAQSMALLITGRVFQGLGGGGLITLSQAIIATIVPARKRGKYMGIMGGAFAVSSVAGPLLGGWLTEGPGWRWAFAINLPLGGIALLTAAFLLKVPHTPRENRPKIDIGGMMLIVIFTTSLTLMSAWGGHDYEWSDPIIIGLIAATVLSAAVFVFVELRVSEPIIPMRLFADLNFTLCTLAGVCIGVAMFGVLSYMPTYLQMVHGIEATRAGLMMTPMMASVLVFSTGIGFVVARWGRYKIFPIVGVIVMGVAMVLLSQMSPEDHVYVPMILLGLLGVGIGTSMQLLVLIVQNSFPVTVVGTATASNNFFRQIGATLGMSVIGSIFTSRLMANLEDAQPKMPKDGGSSGGLTPEMTAKLPAPIHDAVIGAYSDALVPIFLWVAPLLAIAAIILLFIRETPLATSVNAQGAKRTTLPDDDSADQPAKAESAQSASAQTQSSERSTA